MRKNATLHRNAPKNREVVLDFSVRNLDEEQRTFSGIATTPTIDRYNEIIDPLGAKYKERIPLLHNHRHTERVGSVALGKATAEGIPFTATIPKIEEDSDIKKLVNETWLKIKSGLLDAVSIGFVPIDGSYNKATGIYTHTDYEIIELSAVTVPANPDAIITGSSGAKNFSPASGENHSPASGENGNKKTNTATKNMNLEQILKGLLQLKKELELELISMTKKSIDDDTIDLAEINARIKKNDEKIESVKAAIKIRDAAESAPPATERGADEDATEARTEPQSRIEPQLKNPKEKGMQFARFMRCFGLAKGNIYGMQPHAETLYKGNDQIINAVKAAVAAGTVTNAPWAGNATTDLGAVIGDFAEYLRPWTILGKFGRDGVPALNPVPFQAPLIEQTGAGEGKWVGEGKPKPVQANAYRQSRLELKKVSGITVLTDELLRSVSPVVDENIRKSLRESLVPPIDKAFIDHTSAGTASTPGSPFYGATPVTATGSTIEDIDDDIEALFAKFTAGGNAAMSAVIIMGTGNAGAASIKRTVAGTKAYPDMTRYGGRAFGVPVIVSQWVDADKIYLVNADDVNLADDNVAQFDFSREASIEMADDSLTQDATNGTGSSLVSMFQTNCVAFRAERIINWANRRAGAGQYLTGANWGARSTGS